MSFVIPEEEYQAILKKSPLSTEDKARLLVGAVERELAKGVRHFNSRRQPLNTLQEVLTCISMEGGVIVQYPELRIDA